VNSSTINDSTNNGTILVFDAAELGDTTENVGFTPISFITGTTVGKHWIVPGTYISNNYEISYGLGTLTIDPAPLTITAEDKSKTFGDDDPALTYTDYGLLGEDTLSGTLIREAGEDVADYAILQGSLTAGENYTVHYDSATLSILPALITIGITAEDKEYDGTRAATVTLFDDRLSGSELDITYTSALFDNKHVGEMKEVTVLGLTLAGADAGNYVANTEATTTAEITPDSINVRAVTDSKTYDGTAGSDETPVVDPLADGDIISLAPVQVFDNRNAGIEKVLLPGGLLIDDGNEGNNYVVSYVNDSTGSIGQLDILVTAVTDSKTYDGTISSDGVPVVDPLMVDDEVSIVPTQVFGNEDAGTGKTLSATGLVIDDDNGGNNYSITYMDDFTGVITPKAISVTPVDGFLYIREGDPLPVFAFIYMGWIPGDAGNEGYTVLRDSDGAAYDQNSEESAGSYVVTPVPSNGNYTFTYETGILHVNPYGPGTRAVKPVLNCIQEIDTDYFVANFEYKNENDVAVYVPLGEDNFLTGSGIDWVSSDSIPTMFAPGGGSFRVFFDGSALSWTVNSRDGDQKVSNAANANSSSTKCKGNDKKAASVSGSIEMETPDPDQLVAYPNPVVEKVYLSLKGIENYQLIKLYDFAGRVHPLTSIDKRTDRLEIDMAELPAGHYIISIVMDDTTRAVQLIKN
jgi:hypothetical protein